MLASAKSIVHPSVDLVALTQHWYLQEKQFNNFPIKFDTNGVHKDHASFTLVFIVLLSV